MVVGDAFMEKTLADARLMEYQRISGIPVVEGNGGVIKVLTNWDAVCRQSRPTGRT